MTQKLNNHDMMNLMIDAINNQQDAIFKVQGFSMEPFLKHNKTSVTLRKHISLNKGNIILFKYKNEYKLHRIIKIKDSYVIAKGDNSYHKEYLFDKDIIGVVISYETNGTIKDPNAFNQKVLLFLWRLVKPFIFVFRRIYGIFRKRSL